MALLCSRAAAFNAAGSDVGERIVKTHASFALYFVMDVFDTSSLPYYLSAS